MADVTLVQFKYELVPAAPLYLAYGLQAEGIDFNFRFYHPKKGMPLKELYNFLTHSEEILAIGCMVDILPYVIAVLKRLKANFPNKIIILGGTGPTPVAEDILKKFKYVDYIIRGDGTFSLPKLIKKIKRQDNTFSDIPGLVYRDGEKIISNHFDLYPSNKVVPAYQCIDFKKFDAVSVRTSWGCPYNCTYCNSRPVVGKRLVYRNINDVMRDIRSIEILGANKDLFICITDEAFIENRARVIRFCKLMKLSKIKMKWGCFGRINRMDEELLRTMNESNCVEIYFGIESGSDRVLKRIKKGFTAETAIKMLLLTKKYIEKTEAAFIFRYPFEKYRDFIDTISVIQYLRINNIHCELYPLSPVIDSKIYRRYKGKLRFADHAPCLYRDLDILPKECISLVRANPEIFYDRYYYSSKDLPHIMKIYYKIQNTTRSK